MVICNFLGLIGSAGARLVGALPKEGVWEIVEQKKTFCVAEMRAKEGVFEGTQKTEGTYWPISQI